MMSRGTYLRSAVSFWARSSQLRRRVLNSDAGLSLRPGRYRWKCSYQYGLSEPDSGPIRLIDDFRCPPPSPLLSSPPRGAHWLMSGSQWYFHIDTSIDDGAPRNKPYWPAGEWYASDCWADVFVHNGRSEGRGARGGGAEGLRWKKKKSAMPCVLWK